MKLWKRFLCHLTLRHKWNYDKWSDALNHGEPRTCKRCGIIG